MIGEGDKSLPLLAIAAVAGGEWPARSRLALLHFFGLRSAADEGTGHGVLLLTDLKAIFAETGSDRLPSVDMCTRLAHMGERPWPEWRNSKPITQVQLARALAPFRITPQNMKMAGSERVVKGYTADRFADAWTRDSPPNTPFAPSRGKSNRYPATGAGFAGFQPTNGTVTPKTGSGCESRQNLRNSADRSGVADQKPPLTDEVAARRRGEVPHRFGPPAEMQNSCVRQCVQKPWHHSQ
jgi:hypothetical protein